MTMDHNELRVTLAPNLFERNDCVNLPGASGSEVRPDLAAISLALHAGPSRRCELTWACVRQACELMERCLVSHRFWFCAMDCGPNSRVARHRKLWGALAIRGFQPAARFTPEKSTKTGDGSLCFYGAAEVDSKNLDDLRHLLTPASKSFLSLLPASVVPDIEGLAAVGWKHGLSELKELRDIATLLSRQGGIVLRTFGEFDDPEVGVDCIMHRENYALVLPVIDEGLVHN